MPEWAENLTIAETFQTIAFVVTLIVGVWGFVKFVLPLGRKIIHFLEDWFGEPDRPGVPGRAGVLARLECQAAEIAKLKATAAETNANTKPNHGSSSHDRLVAELRAARVEVAELRKTMAGLLEQQVVQNDRITFLMTELQANHPGTQIPDLPEIPKP